MNRARDYFPSHRRFYRRMLSAAAIMLVAVSLWIGIEVAQRSHANAVGGSAMASEETAAGTATALVTATYQSAAPGQGNRPTTPAEVELVTLTPEGFEPTAISRRPGRFLLAYSNRSGNQRLTLRLLSEGRPPLHQVRLPANVRRSWVGEFALPPGTYEVTTDEHPEWRCTLTIQP